MKNVPVKIKLLDAAAVIPKYAKDGDAGFDFCSVEQGIVQSNETILFKTGLAMAVPSGYEIQVRSRSGLAIKAHICVLNSPGTIDSGYRGEIGIILTNLGEKTFKVDIGDRIAQGVLNEVPRAIFDVVEELDETDRGSGGFGSTGK